MAVVGADSARGKQAAFVLRAWGWWQRAFLSRFGAPPWFRLPILWFAMSRTGWERELSDAGRGYGFGLPQGDSGVPAGWAVLSRRLLHGRIDCVRNGSTTDQGG